MRSEENGDCGTKKPEDYIFSTADLLDFYDCQVSKLKQRCLEEILPERTSEKSVPEFHQASLELLR